jgi:hypothetical protein
MRLTAGRVALTALVGVTLACQSRPVVLPSEAPKTARLVELWVMPEGERDLFYGVGGERLAPDPDVPYTVVERKIGGFSDGYDVADPSGQEWSVKFPPEAPTEVVASRIHWGIGYHQPPVYLLREWDAHGATSPNPQLPGRFRPDDPDFHGLEDEGDWSYYENPFVGTRPMNGLLVLQAMLGNSDLKDANNSLYELDEPVEGAARWYVARDVGHTFGRTGLFDAPRGDVDVFERTPFIREVVGDRVVLEYTGAHAQLFDDIRVDDVRWICERLDRLTDRQWRDAFRAGGYPEPLAQRFIRRLEEKIAEGLALRPAPGPARRRR